ncbi:MAG: STAS domain-containing protein [Chitinispirillaceae bacterium]
MNTSKEKLSEWHIISLEGKFVIKQLMKIRKILTEIEIKECSPKIAFDLSKTSYLDSSAITAMLNLRKRLLPKNGRFVLFGPNEDILDILSIVGFDKLIPVYSSLETFIKENLDKN